MQFKVVAVKDTAILSYATPFYVTHVGSAIRGFMDECKNKESPIGKHPEDYELYLLGEFDDQTGEFDQIRPERISSGKDHA